MSERNSDLLGVMLRILVLIHENPGISRRRLSEALGVSNQVISRQIKILRLRFGIKIKSAPRLGYSIIGWGILDQAAFLEKYAQKAPVDRRSSSKKSPQDN